eukprot:1158505-Pelagomonas_calceolata.AAC.4
MVDKPGADTARFPGAAATATDAFGRDVREGASASAVLSFKAGCSSSSCSKSAGCWLALLPRTGLCCTEFWLARERGVWEKEAEEGRGLRLLEPAPPSLPKLLAFPAWRESCCSELVRWMPAGCNGLKCTRSLGRWGLSFCARVATRASAGSQSVFTTCHDALRHLRFDASLRPSLNSLVLCSSTSAMLCSAHHKAFNCEHFRRACASSYAGRCTRTGGQGAVVRVCKGRCVRVRALTHTCKRGEGEQHPGPHVAAQT